jgi:hypothetical protein
MTFGGYDVGRCTEQPMDTTILRSPFFLAVNLTAFVIKFTRTRCISEFLYPMFMILTLLHPVKVCNDIFDMFIVIRDIHSIVELDVLCLELGLEYFEGLRELPLGAHLWSPVSQQLGTGSVGHTAWDE